MGCFSCSSHQAEVTLLNDCYPVPKQLVASAPEYKPLSSDLSKLLYRCTNQSSKLAKVGEELEKRVQKEAVRSTGGYPKSRASLLISLAILRALITDCRRDLALFSRFTIKIINTSLDVKVYQKGELDLEVVGRAASCFSAFSTYTDGNAIGIDNSLTSGYLTVLRRFAKLAVDNGASEKPDAEQRNRTRLIALAALNAASSSDAIFSSNSAFPTQIGVIMPALLVNIYEASMQDLKLETAKVEMDASPSPFFSEYSARRPVNDRRAPSLHAHISGEKGPSESDVLSAALRSLHALVGQCQANQLSHVLDAIFVFLDRQGWGDVERCCWLAERMTSFSTLQYRFVVPTRLVELLIDMEESEATTKHTTVLAMVTTILNSSISLVGIAVSDLLSNLISLINKRIHIDPRDGLLPPLVQCVSSLGTHIYYADQINDIIEEIAIRMSEVNQSDRARPEILRVLVYCMTGVMTTAVAADVAEARATNHPEHVNGDKGKGVQVDTPVEAPRPSIGRRNPISPEVWQETLPLLCESTYAVRAVYARALLMYLENELPRDHKPLRPSEPNIYRFCNAVHAAIYTLAMSSCLGIGSPEPSLASVNASPVTMSANTKLPNADPRLPESKSTEKGVSFNVTESTPSGTPLGSQSGSTPPSKSVRAARRPSLPLNRVNSSAILSSFDNVATPYDFAAILAILDQLNQAVPVAALSTGVPMLLALDKDAGTELVRRPGDGRQGAWVLERKRSIREVVTLTWRTLGQRWGIEYIENLANKNLNSLPEPFEVPQMPAPPPMAPLPMPEDPVMFVQNITEGESSTATQPLLDPEIIVSALAGSQTVLSATGGDASSLVKRLASRWSVETALKDSVERFAPAHVQPVTDTHFDIANVLMNMNNGSYQSLGRPQPKPVDVTDLREALGGGRAEGILSSSPPSIISTAGAQTIRETTPRKKAHNPDVQEVLKEIFKDKSKKKGSMRTTKATPAAVTVVA